MENIKTNTKQPRISLGISSFKKLVLESDVIVDKTLLIKAVLEAPGEVILITRPRRWGKSINLDMLKTFFEIEINDQEKSPLLPERINRKLFTGSEVDLGIDGKKKLPRLKIAEFDNEMNHQGKYQLSC